MPNTNFKYTRPRGTASAKGYEYTALSQRAFESFNSSILGLGDVSNEGKYIQALAAIYDLEGFTSFCNQVDSHLVIPEFLKRFIDWLLSSLAEEFKHGEKQNTVTLWSRLPFFTKFLGDGVLLLWDTSEMDHPMICNIITNLRLISQYYRLKFLPNIKKQVSNPPSRLRCGVARGQIISVGDGSDYVGSCINIAARLQKLSQLPLAISRRGIDLNLTPASKEIWKNFVLKQVSLRGIGDDELIYIDKAELRKLSRTERKLFRTP